MLQTGSKNGNSRIKELCIMDIKTSGLSREELISQLQSTTSELPSTRKSDDRVRHYMNRATGTYFCTLDKGIQTDYIEALVYFEDAITILQKSTNKDDEKKINHCFAAISALRRIMGIY